MPVRRLLVAVVVLSVQAAAAQAQLAASANIRPARYRVTVQDAEMREVSVQAEFVLSDSIILMSPFGMDHLADGWRTFVHDEQATDSAGRILPLRRIEGRRWVVGAPKGTSIHLTYGVRISHDQPADWWPGPREAAYARDWGIFSLGRAWFIIPGATMIGTVVEVAKPSGWRVASSLPPIAGTPDRYRADTQADLAHALFFVGRYADLQVRQGGLTFNWAIAESYRSSIPAFERVTKLALSTFRDVFDGDPAREKYLVVVNPEVVRTDGFGGAFRSGFSMTFPFVPSDANIGVWAFTLTHEVFHLWNAYTISRASPAEEWFVEGGADYYTTRTFGLNGIASRDVALRMTSSAYRQYRSAAGRVSLAAAGASESRSGDLLYKGGWIVLAALDLDIRRRTHGSKSLDDVFRTLNRKPGRSSSGYRNEDIAAAASEAAGADYSAFFQKYVNGTEIIDIAPYVEYVGLVIRDGWIVPREGASAEEQARLAAWLGK